jgi:hypothetical protein
VKEGFNYCWPTPVFTGIISDKVLLEKTCNYVLSNYGDEIKVKSNLVNENILENKNLLEFKDNVIIPAFDEFYKKEFELSLKEKKYHLKAWITGKGFSHSMPLHNHSGSYLSAVFYLLCEENHKGGELVLQDPRFNANRGYKEEYNKWFNNETITPKTGQFIIFPSFLYHNVKTFYGKIRLAMPVDLILY